MKTAARFTGYTSLVVFFTFLSTCAFFLWKEAYKPARLIKVHFQEIGTLISEDPVLLNGVPIGQVRRIYWDNEKTLAEIELFQHDFLPSDARFVNFNYSLMGARMVVLVPGHSETGMDESQVQEGFFASGVAETIHRVEDLLNLVKKVQGNVDNLFVGSNAPFSAQRLQNHYQKTLDQLHRISAKAEKTGHAIEVGATAINQVNIQLLGELTTLSNALNPTWKDMDSTLNSTLAKEVQLDQVLTSLETLFASMQAAPSVLNSLTQDRKLYDNLTHSLDVLETALQSLQKRGLQDIFHFWRNIHLFKGKKGELQ